MARSSDAALRRVWEDRLRRYACSDITVAGFCERERVSVPSFYHWRRKIADSERSSSGAAEGKQIAQQRPLQAFVPVRITQATTIEMRLSNGVRFLLPAGDEILLAAAITAAGRLRVSESEGEAC
jgi:hypothetical protein